MATFSKTNIWQINASCFWTLMLEVFTERFDKIPCWTIINLVLVNGGRPLFHPKTEKQPTKRTVIFSNQKKMRITITRYPPITSV